MATARTTDPLRPRSQPGSDPGAGERLVLTVAEAGELLGISRAFAYELAARGELPVIRLGRRLLVPKLALLALALVGMGADDVWRVPTQTVHPQLPVVSHLSPPPDAPQSDR